MLKPQQQQQHGRQPCAIIIPRVFLLAGIELESRRPFNPNLIGVRLYTIVVAKQLYSCVGSHQS